MSQLKIYFCADVHGSEIVFGKFLNAGKFYKTDVMMLSGDITGKMVVPIIRQKDGSYSSEFMGKKYNLKNEGEVRKIEESIGNSGYYSYLTSEEELKELGDNKTKAQEIFSRLMTERLKKWIRLAEERLHGMDVKCYVMPGNDDESMIDQILEDSKVVLNPEGKVLEIAGYEMINTGFGNSVFSKPRFPTVVPSVNSPTDSPTTSPSVKILLTRRWPNSAVLENSASR